MAPLRRTTTKLHHLPRHLHHRLRTFVDARIKWVRDPYLDKAVQKEKNLKQLLSFKNLIVSQPSKTLPISTASLHKPHLNLPFAAVKFIQNYPAVFQTFKPSKPLSLPHVRLTPQALLLHARETQTLNSPIQRKAAAERLAKFLMLTRAWKLPLYVIDRFKFDLGLPHDFILKILPDFPDYFEICDMGFKDSNGSQVLGLELISWRDDLGVSVLEKKRAMDADFEGTKGMPITYSMNFPRGFDLQKKVKNWVDEWQKLPYISPYEDAFNLSPSSDQSEKWAVAVLHELLHLLVSKKTEKENVLCLGDYLGFGTRFKKALVHHPGIFYVSNKIRTQTVVLREAYKKQFLIENHPLMDMRFRYVDLMNTIFRWGRPFRLRIDGPIKQVLPLKRPISKRTENYKKREKSKLNDASDSEVENVING